MTEIEELKAQLIAVYSLALDVEATDSWQDRKHALEDMHRAIMGAAPILRTYAADIMVGSDEAPEAWVA